MASKRKTRASRKVKALKAKSLTAKDTRSVRGGLWGHVATGTHIKK